MNLARFNLTGQSKLWQKLPFLVYPKNFSIPNITPGLAVGCLNNPDRRAPRGNALLPRL